MYSFDNLGDLSGQQMVHLVLDSLVGESVREIDLPHLVLCTDLETGAVSYEGPYPDGMTALAAAESESTELDAEVSGFRFTVAPLLPTREMLG
jgi:hypothetical protein